MKYGPAIPSWWANPFFNRMQNGNHNPADLELDAPERPIDLEQIWFVLREKAWFIALFGLVGIFGGLAYIQHTPLTYSAKAVIQVDPEPVKVVNFDEVQQSKDPIGEEMGQTLLEVFKSRPFLQQAIERSKLLDDPDFLRVSGGRKPTMEEGITAVLGMSRETIRQGTRFIDVEVQHRSPRMAKVIADILAEAFIKNAIDERAETANMAIKYLQDKSEELKKKLHDSEIAQENYVETHHAGSLKDKQDTVVSALNNVATQLDAARVSRMKLEADYDEIKKHLNDPEALLAIPSVANHPTIIACKRKITDLDSEIVTYLQRYTEEHPKMKLARAQLADAKQALIQNVLKIPPVIQSSYETAVAMEDKFTKAMQEQEKLVTELNKQGIDYNAVTRDVETDGALYEAILKRLKEAKVGAGIESTNVHVFAHALLPVNPVQPRKSRTLAISFAAGILLGIALGFGLNALDSSIKTVDQAEQVLGLTVLAAVPRRPQNHLKENSFSLVREPGSAVSEAFRSLRTAIHLAGRNKGRKIVLFTSALANEGKTFCSINYATALAQQGLRTLLVDADLRSPMVASVLLPNMSTPGLAELLSKKSESVKVRKTEIENLSVLTAGVPVPKPAELLAGSEFGEVIKQLAERFDRIVIDTAPVTAVSDTLLLVEHAQAICLVVRAGKTPRKWILRASKLLAEAGVKPTGTVLNQVPMHMAGAYSYYPGRYGESEVYGANGSHQRHREKEEPVATEKKRL